MYIKLCPWSLLGVARSQFYVQRFQIPEGHLQRQVQPPCDHPQSGEAQGSKGSAIGNKRGIVPIGSGKRATAGLNGIVLKVRNDGPRFRNVKSRRRGCNVVTFLRGGTKIS